MWDEIKDVFMGPVGPWICVIGLVIVSLLWHEGEQLLYTPIAFALATMIVAKNLEFAVWDQYILILAVFFGVYYAMPHRQRANTSKPDTLKKDP